LGNFVSKITLGNFVQKSRWGILSKNHVGEFLFTKSTLEFCHKKLIGWNFDLLHG